MRKIFIINKGSMFSFMSSLDIDLKKKVTHSWGFLWGLSWSHSVKFQVLLCLKMLNVKDIVKKKKYRI